MKKHPLSKVVLLSAALIAGITGTTIPAAADPFTLSLDVPQYCQYDSHYCGAASAQMIMNGYPDAAARKIIHQPTIYTWIQTNQTEPEPYKAPGMVRDAIHHFNMPPTPAHFAASADTDAQSATFRFLGWMSRTNYPAAVMINGGHWVVVTAFDTNVDPQTASSVTLNWIEFNDPLPFCT